MLTDAACRNAKCPTDKPRARFADSGNLYLEVAASGSKRWFWKYFSGGKEKRLALGAYPTVGLKDAREGRDTARKLHEAGTDPVQARKIESATQATKSANTFEAIARELHGIKAPGWSESHAAQWLRAVEKDLFPWIGPLPIVDVDAPVLLAAIRRIEGRGSTQMAHDVREYAGQVFRYAIQTGRGRTNPAGDLIGALKPHVVRHHPALKKPEDVRRLLLALPTYTGQPTTVVALALSAMLFQRPGNMRALEWAWIDLEDAMLTLPPWAMKRRKHGKLNGPPHFVPLPLQAVAMLRNLLPLTGQGKYVFPSVRGGGRPMSDNTLNAALRSLGFDGDEMTAHGFRAMARTVMVERIPGTDPEVIEAQLAHTKSGPLGEAYDRAEYMVLRRQLMQVWADYLDQLRDGAKVIALASAKR
ncbi:integrase [Pelomonas sp. Root1217]|uniref:tyrosine-type recombinase/integrase n=1 Tax=Pelomonas sp. Root1217 TaxID=1736430 RepID=UPI00070F9C8C|nr:integrase arm-type DNA-binding domain-containing protein [Pelomonas sp. Root1217]KQV60142.1 integrase [Pelomonas sp. Root1217]